MRVLCGHSDSACALSVAPQDSVKQEWRQGVKEHNMKSYFTAERLMIIEKRE